LPGFSDEVAPASLDWAVDQSRSTLGAGLGDALFALDDVSGRDGDS
jgi:hypothetical protein